MPFLKTRDLQNVNLIQGFAARWACFPPVAPGFGHRNARAAALLARHAGAPRPRAGGATTAHDDDVDRGAAGWPGRRLRRRALLRPLVLLRRRVPLRSWLPATRLRGRRLLRPHQRERPRLPRCGAARTARRVRRRRVRVRARLGRPRLRRGHLPRPLQWARRVPARRVPLRRGLGGRCVRHRPVPTRVRHPRRLRPQRDVRLCGRLDGSDVLGASLPERLLRAGAVRGGVLPVRGRVARPRLRVRRLPLIDRGRVVLRPRQLRRRPLPLRARLRWGRLL